MTERVLDVLFSVDHKVNFKCVINSYVNHHLLIGIIGSCVLLKIKEKM